MMMAIRPYEPSDADAVWELHNLALQGTGAHLGNGPWDDDLRNILAVYQQAGGAFFVGVVGGRIAAMGAVKRVDADRAEIKRMRVHPDFQRRGLGRAMLQALENEAARLGYRIFQLDTTVLQTAARALYETDGYRVIRRGKLAGLDTLWYEKRLGMGGIDIAPANPCDLDRGVSIIEACTREMASQGISQCDALYPDRDVCEEDIAKDSPAFRAAYRECILDLQAARGLKPKAPAQDDGWYLDQRVKALGWRSFDNRIVGFCLYSNVPFFYDDVDAEVLDIWVEPTSRRRGYASGLVKQAVGSSRGRVGLQVHMENASSLAFWRHVAETNCWDMVQELVGVSGERVWKTILAVRCQ